MPITSKKWVDIWTIVCFILGFVGNSFVLLFYIYRIKRQHREDRYFIPILAFTDLTANLLFTIHNIIDYLYLVTFPSSQLCTALFFLSAYSPLAVIFLIQDFDWKTKSVMHPEIMYPILGIAIISVILIVFLYRGWVV
jgi:hypothetical protein